MHNRQAWREAQLGSSDSPPLALDVNERLIGNGKVINIQQGIDKAGFPSLNGTCNPCDPITRGQGQAKLVCTIKTVEQTCFKDGDGTDKAKDCTR